MRRKTNILRVILFLFFFFGASGLLGLLITERLEEGNATAKTPKKGSETISVEVAPVVHGPLEMRRTFSGTLEARAQFVVAPKVSGRIERIAVNLSDKVERGQLVAELDLGEYSQEVDMASADLAVAKANLAEAKSALEVASRDVRRFAQLRKEGIISESQYDSAKANELAKNAELDGAMARLNRADSMLETAKIRLGYTRITANWSGGKNVRTVAERYIDEGETVSENTPLLKIIELDPIKAVIFVTESDYARLHPNQPATLITDAFPGKEFAGHIDRIAPMFKEATRQARVEVTIPNESFLLKPGMFIRVTIVLKHFPDTTHIPEQAIHVRNDKKGVFLISKDGRTVIWKEVKLGIQDNGRVQIKTRDINGRVVILGQRLLDNGSPVDIVKTHPKILSLTPTEPL